MSFWKGWRSLQHSMGASKATKSDFKTSKLRRAFNRLYWKSCSKTYHEMERASGCHHCGQEGSVETGPCGGAVAMNHCHACGRHFYGGDDRMKSTLNTHTTPHTITQVVRRTELGYKS